VWHSPHAALGCPLTAYRRKIATAAHKSRAGREGIRRAVVISRIHPWVLAWRGIIRARVNRWRFFGTNPSATGEWKTLIAPGREPKDSWRALGYPRFRARAGRASGRHGQGHTQFGLKRDTLRGALLDAPQTTSLLVRLAGLDQTASKARTCRFARLANQKWSTPGPEDLSTDEIFDSEKLSQNTGAACRDRRDQHALEAKPRRAECLGQFRRESVAGTVVPGRIENMRRSSRPR